MGSQQSLKWQDYFLIAPLYVRYFPDDDMAQMPDEGLIIRVQSLPDFDDLATTPSSDVIQKLRWLIIDIMNKEGEACYG